MIRYVAKRILFMIPVLLGVLLMVFLLLDVAPGDPARSILGDFATEEQLEAKREELGLNDPVLVRYVRYVGNLVLKGDMGISYTTGKPVTQAIFERFPTTVLLAMLGVIMMIVFGLPAGIISAVRQYSWIDNISRSVAMLGVSMPNFWTGLLLIMAFALNLKWLPASGFYGPEYWVLPAVTIGFGAAAQLTRTTRSCMLEVVRQDYIRTARAKGQTERVVTMHHVLRNALIPVVTVIGLQFGTLLGGAMITEQIFSIPGLGKFMVESIKSRDYPIVQGGLILISSCFCLVNLLIDILYAFLDPRIKAQYQGKKRSSKAEGKGEREHG